MSALHVGTGIVEAKTLGKYRLLAQLGRGGMATVHLALMQGPAGFNKLVVIKQILPQHSEDPELLGMFLDEARLAARLRHHNVVQTNEVGQDGQLPFMVMEFLHGQPLHRVIHRLGQRGGVPLVQHLRIIADLLEGLDYAHDLADYDGIPLGVVHRDVTPQNIFVTYDGEVKIVDFGIAKAQTALVHTGIGIVKGKIAYMAPEHICGETIDRRADIFSVGVMLWEAVTGTRPWKGVPDLTVLKSVAEGRFPSARAVESDIPEVLDAIISKALARDREERYATAAELREDLEAFIDSTGERVSRRDLGNLVSKHFASERAEIEAIVQEQLRRHEEEPSTAAGVLPTINQPTTGGDVPGATPGAHPDAACSSPPHTGPSTFAVNVADERPHRVWGRPFVRVGALVAGLALLEVLGSTLKRTPPEALSPQVAMAAVEMAPVPSTPSTVKLRVVASPPEARVFLDDEPLPGNPFEGALPRDRAQHRVRVEADGFAPRVEDVTLDRDRALDLALTGEPPEAQPIQVSSQGGLTTPPASAGPMHGRTRRLDARNPYANR